MQAARVRAQGSILQRHSQAGSEGIASAGSALGEPRSRPRKPHEVALWPAHVFAPLVLVLRPRPGGRGVS